MSTKEKKLVNSIKNDFDEVQVVDPVQYLSDDSSILTDSCASYESIR